MTYVNEYWDSVFKVNIVFENKDISISLNKDKPLMILYKRNKIFLTMNQNIYNKLDLDDYIKFEYLYNQLKNLNIKFHTADNLFYLNDKTAKVINDEHYENTRLLNLDDTALLNSFEKRVDIKELDEAYVKLDHYLTLGYIKNNKLLAVASVYSWQKSKLMDIGIVSDSKYRGQGIAKATVRALSKEVMSHQLIVQYRCSVANMASYYLALACGFELYGKLEISDEK